MTHHRDRWTTPQLSSLSVPLDTAYGEGSATDGGESGSWEIG